MPHHGRRLRIERLDLVVASQARGEVSSPNVTRIAEFVQGLSTPTLSVTAPAFMHSRSTRSAENHGTAAGHHRTGDLPPADMNTFRARLDNRTTRASAAQAAPGARTNFMETADGTAADKPRHAGTNNSALLQTGPPCSRSWRITRLRRAQARTPRVALQAKTAIAGSHRSLHRRYPGTSNRDAVGIEVHADFPIEFVVFEAREAPRHFRRVEL